MENWKEGVLIDIAKVIMGQSPKGADCNVNGKGMPLLNGPTEFGLNHPHPIQFTTNAKRLSKKNDLLFCVRGSTTGRMNWSNKPYAIGRGIAAIRHKKNEEYRLFIKGLIDFNLPLILQSATGSTFPNVSKSHLENLEILIPPLAEQKAIAEVLSSLDDKIDLLHRQNETLEEMAQTLFRQWFVEEAEDSWEECTIEDLCVRIGAGGTPSTKIDKYYNGEIKWYSTKELMDNYLFESERKITKEGLNNSSAKLFPKHTVVIAIYAAPTVGRLGILTESASFNQAACGLVANEDLCSYEFIYLYLKSQREELNSMATGSAQQNLNVTKIRTFPAFIPNNEIMKKFKRKIRPVFNKMEFNAIQIQTLTKLRDTLLPKLMSGEVRVEM